jgi:WD40 repeat protein
MPHSDDIYSLSVSSDGARVLSGSRDGTIKLWDVSTGTLLRTFVDHDGWVRTVAFSRDGSHALSGGGDWAVRLWETSTGRLVRKFSILSPITSVAFSPDGALAYAASYQKVTVWDTRSGQVIRELKGHAGYVMSLSLSENGERLASAGDDKTIKIWDARTGALLRTLTGHGSAVNSVAMSRDGKSLLSGSGDSPVSKDNTVRLWDLATGRVTRTFAGHVGSVNSVAFSPDEMRVLSASSDRTLKIWQVQSGALIRSIESDRGILAASFALGGARLVAGGDRSLQIRDASTGDLLPLLRRYSSRMQSLAFSRDSSRLFVGGYDETIAMWDFATGKLLRTFGFHTPYVDVASIAISRDGSRLATGSDVPLNLSAKFWNVDTGKMLQTFEHRPMGVKSVAFSRDGAKLVSSGGDADVKLWDAATGALLKRFSGHDGLVRAIAFSPNDAFIASGSDDLSIRIWDVKTSEAVHTLRDHRGLIEALAYSPDSIHLVSGSLDHTIKIWEAATGQLEGTLVGHASVVTSVAVSSDNRLVLSGSWDRTVRLWDLTSRSLIRTFEGHSAPVRSVAFSPDRRRAASASDDGSVKIWDVETGNEILTLISMSDDEWLSITPEGFFAASERAAESVNVVRGPEFYSIDRFYQSLYRPDLVHLKLAGDRESMARVAEAARAVALGSVVNSGPAPRLEIVSPAMNGDIAEDAVVAEARIADQGGGIGRVEWRLNGVAMGVEKVNRASSEVMGDLRVRHRFFLGTGTNIIEAVVFNQANLIVSMPASVVLTRKAPPVSSGGRLYVLAIGVDHYADSTLTPLNFAVADARSLADAFRIPAARAGVYDEVVVHEPLVEGDVTIEKLRSVFAELGAVVRPNDVFLLYMSGHGFTEDGEFFFVPQNSRNGTFKELVDDGIGQEKMSEWLAEIPALRSVIIYDSCESGSVTEQRSAFRRTQQLMSTEKLSRAVGRVVMAATTDIAVAKEGDGHHGFFTSALLSGFGLAHGNDDGLINAEELADYVAANLPKASKSAGFPPQIPQFSRGGIADFVLLHRIPMSDLNGVR